MPIKFVCKDNKLKQGELRDKPGLCFKKGLRAGFAAGIQKGTKTATEQGIKRASIVKQIPQAALRIQSKRGIRRARESNARQAVQQAQTRENALMASNDINIEPPRVRPAGRRQAFRAYYGLDRPLAPTQVPLAIPMAPAVINIKDEINRLMTIANPNVKKNRTDLLASIVQREFPDLGGQARIKKMGKPAMIQRLVETGRFVSGGE